MEKVHLLVTSPSFGLQLHPEHSPQSCSLHLRLCSLRDRVASSWPPDQILDIPRLLVVEMMRMIRKQMYASKDVPHCERLVGEGTSLSYVASDESDLRSLSVSRDT
jgi:hypothetical protein